MLPWIDCSTLHSITVFNNTLQIKKNISLKLFQTTHATLKNKSQPTTSSPSESYAKPTTNMQYAVLQMTLGSKTVKRWSTDMLERGQVGLSLDSSWRKIEIFSQFFSRRFTHFVACFYVATCAGKRNWFRKKKKAGSIFGKEFWSETLTTNIWDFHPKTPMNSWLNYYWHVVFFWRHEISHGFLTIFDPSVA